MDDAAGFPGSEQDDDGDGFSECQGDCNDFLISIFPGAQETCDGVDQNCSGTPDDGNILAMCPTPPDVDVTVCNGFAGCGISACFQGFYNTDGQHDTGCNCVDEGVANTCGTAATLGGLLPGNSNVGPIAVVPAHGVEDWYTVAFPADSRPGGGNPKILFERNDNSAYRFEVHTSCGSGSTCGAIEVYSFIDNASDANGYKTSPTAWPQELFIRVVRVNPGPTCDAYQLAVSR